MTNYQNDIMNLLQGETPKQKYEFLKSLLEVRFGERYLWEIKFYSLYGVPDTLNTTIPAHNKDEALEIFWKNRNKEQWEVTSCINIDTLIA